MRRRRRSPRLLREKYEPKGVRGGDFQILNKNRVRVVGQKKNSTRIGSDRIGLTTDRAFSDSDRMLVGYNICAFHSIPIKSDPIRNLLFFFLDRIESNPIYEIRQLDPIRVHTRKQTT